MLDRRLLLQSTYNSLGTFVRGVLMSNKYISSSEFAALCQSQITLLSQSLGAVWSVIYLTEEISEDGPSAQLFPFATYPQAGQQDFWQLPSGKLPEIWQLLQSRSLAQRLPDRLNEDPEASASGWKPALETRQLILPLVHQETFIGLLVTGREDREWQHEELKQIEEIARTLAIARYLESQYHWTRDELAIQENLRRIEHDRLDNLLHQLRNPLTALRTFGKLLIKRLLPEDPNGKLAQNILAQSDRFQALLEQFEAESQELAALDSASNSSKNSLPLLPDDRSLDRSSFLLPGSVSELDSVDLAWILEPLLTTASAIATERDIELIYHLPTSIPKVMGDVSALREILNNLVDNALKYTPSGGKVRLALKTTPSMVGIVVADTGPGIPAEDRERIFERHYRGIQAESEIPGTGLGLAIARELARKMQGEIELLGSNDLSADGSGTTFILWLPIASD